MPFALCGDPVATDLGSQPKLADTLLSNNQPIIASNMLGASYQWMNCENAMAVIPEAINQDYIVPQEEVYAVVVTQNGCTDTSECTTPIGLQGLTNLPGD